MQCKSEGISGNRATPLEMARTRVLRMGLERLPKINAKAEQGPGLEAPLTPPPPYPPEEVRTTTRRHMKEKGREICTESSQPFTTCIRPNLDESLGNVGK